MGLLAQMIARRRLARQVLDLAHAEHDHFHRAGVIEFAAMRNRAELYDGLVQRIRDRQRPLQPNAVLELEALLAEKPPFRDYGPRAQHRNERIARILDELNTAP